MKAPSCRCLSFHLIKDPPSGFKYMVNLRGNNQNPVKPLNTGQLSVICGRTAPSSGTGCRSYCQGRLLWRGGPLQACKGSNYPTKQHHWSVNSYLHDRALRINMMLPSIMDCGRRPARRIFHNLVTQTFCFLVAHFWWVSLLSTNEPISYNYICL